MQLYKLVYELCHGYFHLNFTKFVYNLVLIERCHDRTRDTFFKVSPLITNLNKKL